MLWQVPLSIKPHIAQIGIGIHGVNQARDRYRLPKFWCAHLYRYHAELVIGDKTFPICPGSVSVIAPDTPMEFRYRGKSVHLYAHFAWPASAKESTLLPAVQDAGAEFGNLDLAWEQAIRFFPTQQLRADVRWWDILWQLAHLTSRREGHPAVQEARRLIELRLSEPIYVPGLSKEVGVSQNHLARLFRAELGMTATGYIRQRRTQRASHLLRNSTLAIKAIAAEVGIPDLHLFNKTMRAATGKPPRQCR